MSRCIAVLGAQWGDEGKGKIVDLLARQAAAVVRFQGGHNAGHTVTIKKQRHIVHLLPSGAFHPQAECLIGQGVVVSPEALQSELEMLHTLSPTLRQRLAISPACTLLMPYHQQLDKAQEGRAGEQAIGTTGRGIGPAYEDKIARRGLRLEDLYKDSLQQRLAAAAEHHNVLRKHYQLPLLQMDDLLLQITQYADLLRPFLADIPARINQLREQGGNIIFEGAQGLLLDIDHGSYPFVTSSSTSIGGLFSGCGVSPKDLDFTLGVAKAYQTRVGNGPMPTELHHETGQLIAERGREFGATTGRARRCGWLDLAALRHTIRRNGIDALCLTKLDVLDSLPEICLCVDYDQQQQPRYETIPGWQQDSCGSTRWEQLPPRYQNFVQRIERFIGIPITMLSTGPERDQTIIRRSPF